MPACLPRSGSPSSLRPNTSLWTAGLGAINSRLSPGGQVQYDYPFQIRELELELVERSNCSWQVGTQPKPTKMIKETN